MHILYNKRAGLKASMDQHKAFQSFLLQLMVSCILAAVVSCFRDEAREFKQSTHACKHAYTHG